MTQSSMHALGPYSADFTTCQRKAVDLPPVSELGPSRSPRRENSQGPSLTKRRSVVMTCIIGVMANKDEVNVVLNRCLMLRSNKS